ncbi:serine/threonine-protein kinase ULK1 isoform X3 [Pelobates fuscus]|uniref:serine/threonine-protein kinase ULK1 isoform X3 n=1 Tax=Pelobates fuscus TaxID=191477 RepID=UPI002FE4F36E
MFSPPSPLFAAMKEDEEVVTVGKFEFNKKDLIGTGAFAAVYKGRHLEKQGFQVAIKAINKRKLAKSQSVLGKEIKILKELKHENIVALYDFKEVNNFAYLVMEYCNGGDLADYLHTMRTLSEDTIRIFLIQIAGAMKLLHSKGIIHRDLKPQNILLTCAEGRRYNPNNIRLKIADFGFARHLQYNMMAATICGSPMYMAPEVILSQHYDAKADLWSIGTIIYQCLTGRAPFQARNPDELRIYYLKNKILIPNIPRETSSDLRHLLLGLLQRNQNDRMDFEQFFHHPYLNATSSVKKSAPVPVPSYPSSGSGSSCSSSSTSHLASPLQSLAEIQPLQSKTLVSPMPDSPGFFQESKESAGSSGKNSSSDPDDFVMVPAQFPSSQGEIAEAAVGRPVPDTLMYSGSLLTSAGLDIRAQSPSPTPPYNNSPSPSRLPHASSSRSGHSVPIPVPTQIQNYRRIEQHLQSSNQYTPPRSGAVRKSNSASPLSFLKTGASPPFPVESNSAPTTRRLSFGGAKPYVPSRQVGTIPEKPGQNISTSPAGAEHRNRSPVYGTPAPVQCSRGMGSRLHSAPNLSDAQPSRQKIKKQNSDPIMPQDLHPVPCLPHQAHMQSPRSLRSSPKLSEFMQRSPLPTILGSPTKSITPFEFPRGSSSQNLLTLLTHQGVMVPPTRNKTLPDLKNIGHFTCQQPSLGLCPVEEMKEPFGRSLSTGRLTDLLLKAAFGTQTQVVEVGSNDSLNAEKSMEIAAPLISYGGNVGGSLSPAPVTFTVGSPPDGTTPPQTTRTRMFSGSSSSQSSAGSFTGRHLLVGTGVEAFETPSSLRCTFPDLGGTNVDGAIMFEVPELPEETLMEQEHTDMLRNLRFTVAFAHSIMEIAVLKGSAMDASASVTSDYQMQESVVADQISLLSREWSYAEQLVLYLRTTELLSNGIQSAMEHISTGKLCLSSTVKQVVKKLNELYKSSISSCHCLNVRLQRFFTDKQKLMDRINSITAEKLIFSYAIQMVQSAALDEMFHHREDCVHRYHRALLLMDGLLNFMTEEADIDNITKCKFCIERRLYALQSSICA